MAFSFLDKSVKGPDLDLSSVSLTLGNTAILEDISFKVNSGSVHALIGPNGGGKTSLFKSMLGQMPHKGDIKINWNGGKTIGYVPQFLAVPKNVPLTVDDFMAVSIQKLPAFFGISKNFKDIISKALSACGVGDKGHMLMGDLSGGERQRVLIAQALIPMPSLLILDEPLSSIDTVGADLFEDMIRTMKSLGVTVLLIHHDLLQVKKLADEVTCINKRVIFSGDPEKVMDEKHIFEIFSAATIRKEAQ